MKAQRLLLWTIFFTLIIWVFKWDGLGKWMYPISYIDEIRTFSQASDVDPFLVAAIIRVESNFRTGLTSSKGAKGVMQIMPDTATWMIKKHGIKVGTDLNDLQVPQKNIEVGTTYLKYLMTQFPNNDALLLAAYNAGQGTVRKWIVSGVWDGTYAHVEQIPYSETRHYVKRVLFFKEQYQTVYRDTFSSLAQIQTKETGAVSPKRNYTRIYF